jgi:hypothetical protein
VDKLAGSFEKGCTNLDDETVDKLKSVRPCIVSGLVQGLDENADISKGINFLDLTLSDPHLLAALGGPEATADTALVKAHLETFVRFNAALSAFEGDKNNNSILFTLLDPVMQGWPRASLKRTKPKPSVA